MEANEELSSLLEDIPPLKLPDTRRIVGVQFHANNRLVDCDAQGQDYRKGAHVVVETKRGVRLGEVIKPSRAFLHRGERLPKVIRKATEQDLEQAAHNTRREDDAFEKGIRVVQERGYPFKLIGAEWASDGTKVAFFFCSEDKIEFKDFVYEMGAMLHTRVEMRQVGIRDQAGMAGGVGVCGRDLCCSSWLKGFKPISIKMAKNQNLALDNEKLTGQCGRLKCCLGYEDDVYKQELKRLPKRGFKFEMAGERHTVISVNPMLQKLLILDPNGHTHLVERETFLALLCKPDSSTNAKTAFMSAEDRALAEELAPDVSLEAPPDPRLPQVAAIRGRVETEQVMSDLSAAFRDTLPGDSDESESPTQARAETGAEPRRSEPRRGEQPREGQDQRKKRRRPRKKPGDRQASGQGGGQDAQQSQGGQQAQGAERSGEGAKKSSRRRRGGRKRRSGGSGGGSSGGDG